MEADAEMEYITVREAARRWNSSEKLIRQRCAAGLVPGARKFGGAWAIPDVQESSSDETSPERGESAGPCPALMPLLNSPFPPGRCLEYIEGIADSHIRDIARSEYFYFSGQPEEAARLAELYLSAPDPQLRLSACLLYAYANLSTGMIQKARRALTEVRSMLTDVNADTPPELRAAALFTVTAAAVLLHLPLPHGSDEFYKSIKLLPPGLRLFALYVQAHYTYLQGDYGKSIGILETAFAMETEVYPIPLLYMHLAAVMDYMSLKQPDKAEEHLRKAWHLAQPDDLIEGFGEHHGLVGGMLEAVLKKDYPEDFKRIIAITYRFSAGWRKVHNPVTGHDVADNLTTTEFATAMLAARGWTNQEIADHMGISPNTVKQYISNTLQKLNIRQRKDLKQYMLR